MKTEQLVLLTLLALFASTFSAQSQTADDDEASIELDYSMAPEGNSIGVQTFNFSTPVYGREFDKSMVFASIDYGLTSFNYDESIGLPSELDNFHSFTLELGILKTLKKNWELSAMFMPTLNSNLKHSIVGNDILWTGGVFLSKYFEKKYPSTLTFGIGNFPYAGRPEILPFVSYEIEIKKFVLSFGFPDSEILYYINKRSSVNAMLLFAGNSFFFGQEDGNFLTGQSDKIDFSSIIAGLGYDRLISERFGFYTSVGYEFYRTYQLLSPENEPVVSFNLGNTINANITLYYIL